MQEARDNLLRSTW